MLTKIKKRSALLVTLAVACATVAIVPQTAGAAATVNPNVGSTTDMYEAPDNRPVMSACPGDSAPAAGFSDTTSTDVDCIKTLGITQGTTATTYEPDGNIPRWQMALFIHRMFVPAGVAAAGLVPGVAAAAAFTDTSGLSTEIQAAITALASHGITAGTTATTFSPNDNVTREQMAMFLSRFADIAKQSDGTAIASTKGTGKYNFTDIASTTFEGMESIIRLYNLGATGETCLDGTLLNPTGGCASTYRPSDAITRAEMAGMLVGVLNHTNARPSGTTIQQSSAVTAAGQAVSVQISVRNADGSAQANTNVDEFHQVHVDTPGTAAQSPWTAVLNTCAATVSNTAGTSKCIIDANDSVTDIRGNLAGTNLTPNAYNTAKWWVWTGDAGAQYVNGTTSGGDTFELGWGAASTLQAATGLTLSSDKGKALDADHNALSALVTLTDGNLTYAGESRTFTATLTTPTATATAHDGYSIKVATVEVDHLGNTTISNAYYPFSGKVASWTTTCPADNVAGADVTYKVAIQHTITMGTAVGTGIPTLAGGVNPTNSAGGGANSTTTYGTGIGNAGTTHKIGVSCDDTARAYAETSTGEALAISANAIVSSTAGTMVAVTATAYDQYGAGIAGVETEITSSTDVDAANGADTLRARLTTGTGGTATLSAVVCAGTTDRVEWTVADADTAATNEMDAVSLTAAGADLGGLGTTVYCAAAGADGAQASATAAREVVVFTFLADIGEQDSGVVTIGWGGFGNATITSTQNDHVSAALLHAQINALAGVSGVVCASSAGDTVVTCTAAADTGAIGNGVFTLTSTLEDANNTNAAVHGSTPVLSGGTGASVDGVDGVTFLFVEHNAAEGYFIAEKKVTSDAGTDGATATSTAYLKYLYDDTDAYDLGTDGEIATLVPGATKAQFETEMASLTGVAGATPMSISYRTGALTTGVSAFKLGT